MPIPTEPQNDAENQTAQQNQQAANSTPPEGENAGDGANAPQQEGGSTDGARLFPRRPF